MPESQRLYERIAQEIAEAIARGAYAIGQRLPSERDLAQKFGVSRPTVREAMIALELDGLVDVRTGSGVYVTHSSPPAGVTGKRDIGPFELLEARRAIEGEACAMAAARITVAQLTQLRELVASPPMCREQRGITFASWNQRLVRRHQWQLSIVTSMPINLTAAPAIVMSFFLCLSVCWCCILHAR